MASERTTVLLVDHEKLMDQLKLQCATGKPLDVDALLAMTTAHDLDVDDLSLAVGAYFGALRVATVSHTAEAKELAMACVIDTARRLSEMLPREEWGRG